MVLAVRDLNVATRNGAHGRGLVVAVPHGARLCTVYARFYVVEMESPVSAASWAGE